MCMKTQWPWGREESQGEMLCWASRRGPHIMRVTKWLGTEMSPYDVAAVEARFKLEETGPFDVDVVYETSAFNLRLYSKVEYAELKHAMWAAEVIAKNMQQYVTQLCVEMVPY